MGANRFGVMTQGIPIATRTRLLNSNYVATLSKYVPTQFKSKLKEQVVTGYKELRQRQRQRLKAMSQHKFFIHQFGLEFWGSTIQLIK